MIATSYMGKMEIVGDTVQLSRKLLFGKSKGTKSIAIRSITSVQFKRAGLTAGYLQIAFSGSKESKGGLMDAAQDENTIMFYKKDQPAFEAMRDAIERARATPIAPLSAGDGLADQIGKLAALRDAGALDEAEFAAAKAKLISGG